MLKLLAIVIPLFVCRFAFAEAVLSWNKIDEDHGVLIFERDEGGLLAFKAEGIVDGSVRAVASAILDSDHTSEWVDHLEEDKIIRRPSPGQYLEYTHVSTPFVIKDRDFLCEVNVLLNEKDKVLVIESHSVEDTSVPPTGFVRGFVKHNEFRLTPVEAAKKTKLVGEFHIDPKGEVPRWVVNMFQRSWPLKAFQGIQKRVASGKPILPLVLESVLAPLAKF